MDSTNLKKIDFIDKLIFISAIIFLTSAMNSIFLNQLGYYSTLLLILIKAYLTKENPFPKTGLEITFLVFVVAEILSTIFSLDFSESFHGMLKKFLLIPTLYTFTVAAKDLKKVKHFVMIYLGSATLTLIYYLIKSYDYFISDLYQTQASGPSVFQYPITSSELMSFSVLILFAFLINEKSNIKYKLLVLILFLINLLALIATYKRTGWMGAAAGMLLIIVLNKKWFLLFPISLLLIAAVLLSKGTSLIYIYDYNQPSLKKISQLNTNGSAYSCLVDDDKLVVSDYQQGLLVMKDSTVIEKYGLPAPIIDFKKWNDDFYIATLADTRFVLLKKEHDNTFSISSEFITAGTTTATHVANNFFYVLDQDSGLTIFINPSNLKDTVRYNYGAYLESQKMLVDSNYFVTFSKRGKLTIFSMEKFLPDEIILEEQLHKNLELAGFVDRKLIFNSSEGLSLYSFNEGKLNYLTTNKETGTILNILSYDQHLFSYNTKGELLEFEYPLRDKLILKSKNNLGYIPGSISFNKNKIFTTYIRTNRLYSFIDPYYPTNYSRLAFWKAGWEMFMDYPLLGVGDIDLAKLYRVYKRPYDKEIQGHLHNNYFHSLATLGTIGFIAIMFLFIKVFLVHLSLVKKLKSVPFASSFSLGAIGGYVSFLVAGLTEYNFGDHEVITLVWFTLALSIAFSRNIKIEGKNIQ